MASLNNNDKEKMMKWQVLLRQRYHQVLIAVTCLVVGFLFYDKISYVASKHNLKGSQPTKSLEKLVLPLEAKGTVIDDTELFYMLPTSSVVGILVFFHGCNHAGQDMFRLPEDRVVAKRALDRGLAVLSPTSSNRNTGCWSRHDIEQMQTNQVLEKFLEKVHLSAQLPRMGMGASSGGNILFTAHNAFSFRSIVSYIMPSGFSQFDWDHRSELNPLPAVGYVHMPRDTKRAKKVPDIVSRLSQEDIAYKVWEVQPHPLTSKLCQQRIPELAGRCEAILNYVQETYPELMDHEYNILEPYTSGKWEKVFVKSQLDPAKFAELKERASQQERGSLIGVQFSGHSWLWAALVEEIAVSYGKHEMTAEYAEEVLDFLMEHAGLL